MFAACLFPDGQDAQSLLEKVDFKDKLDLIKVDVTKSEDLLAARVRVQQRMSEIGLTLHAIVNNAGVLKSNFVTLDSDPTVEDYEFQMNVNFYGVVRAIINLANV